MNGVKLLFWAVAGALLIGAGATPCRAEDNAIIKGKIIFAGDMAKCKRSILDTGKETLKVLNGDNTNHNIHFLPKKNQQYNFSQPKKDLKKGRDLTLMAEDVFKVKCDVHPWMGCRIGVFTHPFFAVTGKDGTFELKNVPPGTYVIEAWHEKFGSVTMNVVVALDEIVEKDFTFDPK